MKNMNTTHPVNEPVQLNDDELDQINGGVLLEAAIVGTVAVGTAIVGAYVYRIVKVCKLRKVWAEEKRQRRAQKAAESAAATAAW